MLERHFHTYTKSVRKFLLNLEKYECPHSYTNSVSNAFEYIDEKRAEKNY